MKNTNKIFLGEFIGSSFLVMVIVGAGIMAENLTNDNALRLTANTLAAGAGLFVLITAFANPAVAIAKTFTDSFTGINYMNTPTYILAEFLGALIAVYLIKKLIK